MGANGALSSKQGGAPFNLLRAGRQKDEDDLRALHVVLELGDVVQVINLPPQGPKRWSIEGWWKDQGSSRGGDTSRKTEMP